MPDRHVDHLLIGGGTAAPNAARHLRENSEDSILLVGREPQAPYYRPALTKDYLAAGPEREIEYFRPAEFWDEQQIELLTRTSVTALDTAAHEATLADGQVIGWGKVLLATGANVNQLHVPGMDQDGIHYLRVFGNADAILEDLDRLGRRVVLIGGGFIGCEVAATLAGLGCECTIVQREELPMQRPLGDGLAGWAKLQLEQQGVIFRTGETLASFAGDGSRVTSVVCESGAEIECDVVVIGAGAHPETTLAKQAGLEIGPRGGVVTDAGLRSSAEDVFAAGDVAEWYSAAHEDHVRIEHWDVAFNHGRTAAMNMLGKDVKHDVIPYFWSHLVDVEIESVGPAYGWDREIVRGSFESSNFSVWYVQGSRIGQVATVGRSDELDVARRLLAARAELSDEQLAAIPDDDFDIDSLA